ncbi:MAG: helix-turn-helix domain-containing protein [Actinomycetota bacterium]|nr:helix-turn-helix domain-containing protein [Actinomycetota bacterium]
MGDLLTATEVAKRLRVSVATVNRYAREGLLPAVRLPGGTWRYRVSDIDELLIPVEPTGPGDAA